ncbi:MAG: hypothetical protein ACK4MF_03340, partial [Hyphomicrobiaceae bacterium]
AHGVSTSGDLAAHAALKQHYTSSVRLLAPSVIIAHLTRQSAMTRSALVDTLSKPLGIGANTAVLVDVTTDPELSSRDMEALAEAVIEAAPEALHVRAIRERASGKGRAGFIAAGGKAVAAAGSLAGALIGGSRREPPPRA